MIKVSGNICALFCFFDACCPASLLSRAGYLSVCEARGGPPLCAVYRRGPYVYARLGEAIRVHAGVLPAAEWDQGFTRSPLQSPGTTRQEENLGSQTDLKAGLTDLPQPPPPSSKLCRFAQTQTTPRVTMATNRERQVGHMTGFPPAVYPFAFSSMRGHSPFDLLANSSLFGRFGADLPKEMAALCK
ncbi:hypothetical protein NHX12_030028 [Muraenolepis orangiensis]|uniref:Uncharacterized protein n=1 Tax=Muraenolepis orangiensis TaxID=630683 RepID=A0A9Q0E7D1_9TELE|nr:hypothetical protein NHX12_030028 [Muraenolepis orangiensis]